MTLLSYKQTKNFKAAAGMPGQTKEMYGEGADDLELLVPCGTVLKEKDTGVILAHLVHDGETYIALTGGK
jgi:GTP-binding protein